MNEGWVSRIIWLRVALLVADLASTAISNIGGYWGDVAAVRMRRILSTRYFDKLLSLPQKYFDRELTGTVINRLSRNISETTQFLNGFANNFLPMIMTTFAVLIISLYYSWPLALVLFIVFPLFMWLTTLTSKKMASHRAWQESRVRHRWRPLCGGRGPDPRGEELRPRTPRTRKLRQPL